MGTLLLSLLATPAQEAVDCRPVVEQLRKNVSSAPTHVLTLLEDAVIANGGHCVGDFVQTAIEASHADAETVKKIVFVAVTSAPKQAPEIAESAVAAAPKYADSVRAAFAEAFDDKNPRMRPSDPAAAPAWEVAGSPVSPPRSSPAPPSKPAPPLAAAAAAGTPAPSVPAAPTSPSAPSPAGPSGPGNPGNPGNPGIEDPAPDAAWKLLHDGVVEAPGAEKPSPETPAEVVPPPPLGEEPATRKGWFGLSLPALPALPPVDQPIDLYFKGPFGGIPGPGQGS